MISFRFLYLPQIATLNLRNSKSPSNDHIVNEYIKNTIDIFLPIYESLFNVVFDTGILPDSC